MSHEFTFTLADYNVLSLCFIFHRDGSFNTKNYYESCFGLIYRTQLCSWRPLLGEACRRSEVNPSFRNAKRIDMCYSYSCFCCNTWSDNKVRELATVCLLWQHWTKALVWFDDVDLSAFHSCVVVVVDLWQSLSEWHQLISECLNKVGEQGLCWFLQYLYI